MYKDDEDYDNENFTNLNENNSVGNDNDVGNDVDNDNEDLDKYNKNFYSEPIFFEEDNHNSLFEFNDGNDGNDGNSTTENTSNTSSRNYLYCR